jgi:acetyl-CoA acyltransferase 2
MFPTDVVIVAGARTPMARYTGMFSEVSAIELGAHAAKAAIQRSGVDASEIDHVIFGNVLQTSADAIYGARHVGLKAGLKVETPAVTVNRLCGSGLEAIVQAGQRLLLGEANFVLAGGMENMTQAPFVIRGARTGLKLGGGALEDFLFVGLTDTFCGLPMALTAEELGGTDGDHAKGCGCLCVAEPAGRGGRSEGRLLQGRDRAGGSEAGEKSDAGERR